ncbi:hypothetical protein AVEN_272585-1 [Araneus ventricosus]|uniref:Uncharacterized protein n=1 Tax=Araneus ventricosus TaxID=182803 RepID=A0A4Y2LC73_ARAVE|nr:hypothetical protein AVEN_272585-1 [Araneus ventricosus]
MLQKLCIIRKNLHNLEIPLHGRSYVDGQTSSLWCVRKFGEGMPAQVSSSSSDRRSNIRCPSQKSPRVASKWDVNIAELHCLLKANKIWHSYNHWILLYGTLNKDTFIITTP